MGLGAEPDAVEDRLVELFADRFCCLFVGLVDVLEKIEGVAGLLLQCVQVGLDGGAFVLDPGLLA